MRARFTERALAALRLGIVGAVLLAVGGSVVAISQLYRTTPAYADTPPYELYCTGAPFGNIVLNNVVSTGSGAGYGPFEEPYQIKIPIPASLLSTLKEMGATAVAGTLTTMVNAGGSNLFEDFYSPNVGPLAFDVPIPDPIPATGIHIVLPSTPILSHFFGGPGTVPPPGTEPPLQFRFTANPSTSISLVLPLNTASLRCTAYSNDALPTSGVTTSGPVGSPIIPVIDSVNCTGSGHCITPGPCPGTATRCFTSGESTTDSVGTLFTFPVTTNGMPTPKIREKGKLPKGVKFHRGTGTAMLSGTPISTKHKSAVGTYHVTFTATFGKGKTLSVHNG